MTQLITEDMMVPSEPGIEIFVRNKRPADLAPFTPERTVLFVHGSTYPAHTGFDIPLGGQSWMEFIASRGYDVYCLDVRGYGRSTRPEAMGEPPQNNPPIARTPDAVKDITAVLNFVLKRRNIRAAQSARLVVGLHADGDHRDPEPRQGGAADALRAGLAAHHAVAAQRRAGPARRLPHRDARAGQGALAQRRARGKQAALIPPGWFEQWADATWATDPVGAKQNPPVVRAPNGTVQDTAEFWTSGKTMYDPAKITAPTLIAIGEWDRDTPPIYGAGDIPAAGEFAGQAAGDAGRRPRIT